MRLALCSVIALVSISPESVAQTDWSPYGCGLNPPLSLRPSSGVGSLGQGLGVAIDNPLGTQAPDAIAALAYSLAPAPGFPCGQVIDGLGLAGPYGPGELLLDGGFTVVGTGIWTGFEPLDIQVAVPGSPDLAGVYVYLQGALIEANGAFGLTEAGQWRITACPGLTGTGVAYEVGREPTAVLARDFNGDGFVDIVTPNESGDDISFLAGLGDGSFATKVETFCGFGPLSGDSADLDGDGDFDVVVANSGSFDVGLLINSGGGVFSPTFLDVPDFPAAIRAVDLDGDQIVDLAVTHEKDDFVSLWMGDGLGGFTSAGTFPVGEEPIALVARDLDGDGFVDLATANFDTSDVSVLWGLGGGGFQPEVRLAAGAGQRTWALAALDLDGDGRFDLVASNEVSDDLTVLLQTAPQSFSAPILHATPDSPREVAGADLDGDGHMDLVVAHDSSQDLGSVSFGRGDGAFGAAQPLPEAGDTANRVALADFDGDGDLDAAFGNKGFSARSVTIVRNDCH